MLLTLEEEEKEKYERIWEFPEYRIACHGLNLWTEHRDWFPEKVGSALDIGCGLGLLFQKWNDEGIDGWGVDHVESCLHGALSVFDKFSCQCLWKMEWPRRFDLGVCTDVLEHIPEEKVQDVLKAISACCDGSILKIAHSLSNDLGGKPLHMTVKPQSWWIEQLFLANKHSMVVVLPDVIRSGYTDSVIKWETPERKIVEAIGKGVLL